MTIAKILTAAACVCLAMLPFASPLRAVTGLVEINSVNSIEISGPAAAQIRQVIAPEAYRIRIMREVKDANDVSIFCEYSQIFSGPDRGVTYDCVEHGDRHYDRAESQIIWSQLPLYGPNWRYAEQQMVYGRAILCFNHRQSDYGRPAVQRDYCENKLGRDGSFAVITPMLIGIIN